MSEDLTQKLPKNGNDGEILNAIKNLDQHVTKIDTRLVNLEQKVDGLERKVDGVEKKVDHLEKKVDERLYDTRPIWHRIVADIAQLQAGQQRLEEGMLEVNNTVRNVNRDQIVINDAIRKIQLDFHTIDARLHKLEINRK